LCPSDLMKGHYPMARAYKHRPVGALVILLVVCPSISFAGMLSVRLRCCRFAVLTAAVLGRQIC